MIETYYKLNEALSTNIGKIKLTCPVYKYGINPSMINGGESKSNYPYINTSYSVSNAQSKTSSSAGVVADFDYQISFFTSPTSEYSDDTKILNTWEGVKNIVSDISLNTFGEYASLISYREIDGFESTSGMVVASKFLICKMRAIVTYAITTTEPAKGSKIQESINLK